MDLLEIAITKQLVGGGGGSGTDNYNELSNQPKINDVTLSGNKTASALGLQNEINSENLLDADLVDDTEADNKFVTSAQMLEWSGKQDKLTFDNVPTSESNNPVKSGGIYIALAGKENSLSANSAAYKDYETTFSANSNDKIPTSKSISDNVADNAKLTNYQAGAGTSFQTIDPTSDKVTDAIEKVQNNALFNKTNILSMWDTGFAQKNVARINDASFTATSTDRALMIPCDEITGTICITIASLVSTDTDASTCAYILYYKSGNTSGSTPKQFNRGSNIQVLNLNLGTEILDRIAIYPSDTYNHSSGDTVTISNLMICTKSQFDISNAYQPYALPNTLITPELIELCDSGAKNLGKYNTSMPSWSGATITVTDDGITVSGTATGAYTADVIPVNIATTTEPYVFAYYGSKSGFNVMLQWKDTTSHYDPFTNSNTVMIIPAGCKIDKVYMQRQTAEAAAVSGNFKVMWCTLADWNVSKKYVPYRPNWDLVYSSLSCDVKRAKVPVSTDYSLIGYVTTKANRVCRVTVLQEYAAVAPTGMILSKSNQSNDFNTLANRLCPPVETSTDDMSLSISALCYYTIDRVVYIWAKAKAASTNGNNFIALCEHFGDIGGVNTAIS